MEKLKELYIRYNELITYVIAGAVTSFVSLFTYYVLTVTFLNPKDPFELQIANVIAWIFAVTFAYFANRFFVFKSKEENIAKEMFKFYLARLGSLGLDMLCMHILATRIGLNDRVSKILDQFIILIANYLISKFIVFRKKNKERKAFDR